MKKKQAYYLIGTPQHNSRYIYLIIFGIIVFLLIFFPFYGISLRYQVGYIFRKIFDFIGSISLTFGAILTLISSVGIIFRRPNFKWLIMGIVLLWIGCWCTGAIVEVWGVTIGSEGIPKGYH